MQWILVINITKFVELTINWLQIDNEGYNMQYIQFSFEWIIV